MWMTWHWTIGALDVHLFTISFLFKSLIHTYDVSMKARSMGHIAVKLYIKWQKRTLKTTTKNSSHKCCATTLCNNRSDNMKDLTFLCFSEGTLSKVSFSPVHFPTHFHLKQLLQEYLLVSIFLPLNHKSFLFSPPNLLFWSLREIWWVLGLAFMLTSKVCMHNWMRLFLKLFIPSPF